MLLTVFHANRFGDVETKCIENVHEIIHVYFTFSIPIIDITNFFDSIRILNEIILDLSWQKVGTNIIKGAILTSPTCHGTGCFLPRPKASTYFGRPVTKTFKSPKWHWLILSPIGANGNMVLL